MSAGFRAVQWNRTKLVYDALLLAGVGIYIALFIAIGRWWVSPDDPVSWEDLSIRAFGTCAFLMLTIILAIGPLARLDRRFLRLLYNRRHFGVLTFLVAAVHGVLNINWFLSRGKAPDLLAILTNWPNYATIAHFPYDTLGAIALLILFLMAATSHDFWLQFLTPPAWKALHMAVYIGYSVLVMHVALGVMQTHHSPFIPLLLGAAAALVTLLHLLAGWREREIDRGTGMSRDGWLVVGTPRAIPDGAARIVAAPGGERIAVFRDGDRIGALTNLCAHQNGPLGEGRIIDGCVTCPWHGYQYRLEDGCAPPPYTEKLATHRVRITDGLVEVDPTPQPPGTRVPLAQIRTGEICT
jgi:nitrite reductase/ring-hydroxylating ferredoxin subunit/DMSO/TMAO reductase YedYZ heme-binding membrane subunit